MDSVTDISSAFSPIDRNIRKKALNLLLREGQQLNAELFVQYFGEIEKELWRK